MSSSGRPVAAQSGSGVPAGGTTGQVLAKASNADGDATWQAGSVPSDASTGAKGLIQLAGDLAGTAASPQIAAGAVGTTELAAGAVTAAKVAADVATQAELDAVAAAAQPLDSDLTAIAALSTTSFGRSLLALADAAAGRTSLGLGTAATQDVTKLKGVVVWTSGAVPARPSGFTSVEWVGPADPAANAQNGDTWVPTA